MFNQSETCTASFNSTENIILFSVFLLIFWCHFSLLPRSEHGSDANSLSARMLYLLHQFFPDAVLAHLVKYCIQPLPTKMGGLNGVCAWQVSNFCGLDKSTIPPVYLQFSTTLYRPSWAAVHSTFFLYTSSSGGHAQWQRL